LRSIGKRSEIAGDFREPTISELSATCWCINLTSKDANQALLGLIKIPGIRGCLVSSFLARNLRTGRSIATREGAIPIPSAFFLLFIKLLERTRSRLFKFSCNALLHRAMKKELHKSIRFNIDFVFYFHRATRYTQARAANGNAIVSYGSICSSYLVSLFVPPCT